MPDPWHLEFHEKSSKWKLAMVHQNSETVGRFVKVDMNGGNVMQLTHGGGRIRRELDPPEGRRRNRDRNEGEILNIWAICKYRGVFINNRITIQNNTKRYYENITRGSFVINSGRQVSHGQEEHVQEPRANIKTLFPKCTSKHRVRNSESLWTENGSHWNYKFEKCSMIYLYYYRR